MKLFSEPAKAICLFLYVLFTSAVILGIVRHISAEFGTFQIVFFYNFVALLCFIPWLIRTRGATLKTTKLRLHGLRAVMEFLSFSLSFYALTQIPMPMHTSLMFMAPIFGTIIAVVVLKERPTSHTFASVMAGFLGVLVITRPGIEAVNIGVVMVLLAALGFATCGNVIKFLTRTDSSRQIAFYMLLLTTLISLPFGIAQWKQPEGVAWLWLIAIGLMAYTQQLAVAHALSKVPYTTVIPLNFAQLIFVAIIAYIFYDEVISGWTVVGSGIIILGTLYNAYQSTRLITIPPAPEKLS